MNLPAQLPATAQNLNQSHLVLGQLVVPVLLGPRHRRHHQPQRIHDITPALVARHNIPILLFFLLLFFLGAAISSTTKHIPGTRARTHTSTHHRPPTTPSPHLLLIPRATPGHLPRRNPCRRSRCQRRRIRRVERKRGGAGRRAGRGGSGPSGERGLEEVAADAGVGC
ncbi:hypothetical protein EJ05DRAFT_478029 [Pseudovirgaria hyperparasitica]|uniref:Uncharacterized protein n=1 Tax=Pseudovirgaria hyperparasitica TaxID=470096 RepID=A0A6A6W313_9PEZI|nr:uncharacterized protein EJ05DRAFT_478029 [Pseudovirgaria hyperparasitica]KAF2755977.1 hypothetical protein EJ05DRAFT_478029 [Pseudovirgaria hyperparasitica]